MPRLAEKFPLRSAAAGLLLWLAAAGTAPAASDPGSVSPGANELETGAPLIRSFRPRDYQGSPAVARVLVHPGTGDLLMLAGTMLHVFDGAEWTAVQTDTPAIRCLAVDPAGRVWLGGVDQLGYCERDTLGRWHFQPLADRLPPEHRKLGRIWDCLVAQDAVWFATDTKVFRWRENAFKVWTFPGTGTLLSAGGQIFFQLKNQALLRWDGAEFRELSRDPLVATASIMRLYAAGDALFEGMTSAGVFFRLRNDRVEPLAPAFKATLGAARLVCALPRPGGGWYAGTDRQGVIITDPEGRLVRRLDHAAGLTDSPVMDLALDRDGALWAATLAGPFQIEQPESVTFFGEAAGVPHGLSSGLARHQGRLYLSTTTGLLELVPGPAPGEAAFKPVPHSPRYTQKMVEQDDGLLIAHAGGLTRLHDETFTPVIETDGANFMTSLAVSRRDPRWLFVGRSAGFTIYARENGAVREARHFPDLGQVRSVQEDADGAVWLGTSTRGIHRIAPATGAEPWTNAIVTTFDTAHGTLPGQSDSVFALPSPFGLLFHTEAGQVRFDATAQRWLPEERFRFAGQPIAALGMGELHGADAWVSANLDREKSLPIFGHLRFTRDTATLEPAPVAVQEALGPIDGDTRLVTVFSALDNLIKGGAGQAVQNLNLMQ